MSSCELVTWPKVTPSGTGALKFEEVKLVPIPSIKSD